MQRTRSWRGAAGQTVLATVLPLFILATAVLAVTNFLPFYQWEYARWRVEDTTGLSEAELMRATRSILAYFWGPQEPLAITVHLGGVQLPLYNAREVAHMADVKQLFRMLAVVQAVTGMLAAAIMVMALRQGRSAGRRYLGPPLLWGGGLTLALVGAGALGSLLAFDRLFLQFHLISFSNDFWLLDPRRDRLVMMFPLGFWLDATLLAGALAAALGLAALVLGWNLLGTSLPPAAAARDAARQPSDR